MKSFASSGRKNQDSRVRENFSEMTQNRVVGAVWFHKELKLVASPQDVVVGV